MAKLGRWLLSSGNFLLTVVLIGFLFIMGNYLSSRHYARWDLTKQQMTAISDQTRQTLSQFCPDRFSCWKSSRAAALTSRMVPSSRVRITGPGFISGNAAISATSAWPKGGSSGFIREPGVGDRRQNRDGKSETQTKRETGY